MNKKLIDFEDWNLKIGKIGIENERIEGIQSTSSEMLEQ